MVGNWVQAQASVITSQIARVNYINRVNRNRHEVHYVRLRASEGKREKYGLEATVLLKPIES